MSVFYSIDSTRVSHREYWWGTRSPLVLLGWLLKWLRVRVPSSTDDPNVDFMGPFLVESLPAHLAPRFGPVAAELAALGFIDPIHHVFHDAGTSTTTTWATYRHVSGEHCARIQHRLWQQATPADRGLFVLFFTPLADGTFVVSSSAKPDLATPETVPMLRRPRATPDALWTAHQEFAAVRAQSGVQPVRTREQLIEATERHHQLLREFHLARGVFRPRSAVEEAGASAVAARLAEATAGGSRHPEVAAEVERLQTQRPGWGNAIVILVVSVMAFVAAGSAQENWKFYLGLIPLLLFHEGGHWVAMKVFGYRNLRMFFIPLFGAAVTGRHYNVPGWKKAIVSLAGPVPGILLGAGLAVAGLISQQEWLNQAAFFLILINGFNLLPVLPLDGGHVLHAILFCRNRWLDIAFRVLAIGALLLLALTGTGRFFLFLAILMGVGLPLAFQLGKITDALRRTPLPPPIPGEDRIPDFTVDTIVDALKAELPARTNSKTLALHTVNVYETLNARPPGALGTLVLLAAHAGSVFLVLVFGMLLALNQHGGGLGNFARAALRQPQHAVECGSIERWSGAGAAGVTSRNLLVSTLRNAIEARDKFRALTTQLPADAELTLLGKSLLLTLPAVDDAARERWFTVLQVADTNTFVVPTNLSLTVSLMCVAPSAQAATNLVEELREYFEVASFGNLIPPWSADAARAGYATSRPARRAWHAIGTNVAAAWTSATNRALGRQAAAALKRGATAEAQRLFQQQEEASRKEQAARYELLRSGGFDAELVDLHARFSALGYTNREERAALSLLIARRLGPASAPDANAPASPRLGAGSGSVRHEGLLIEMSWVTFVEAPAGLPACIDWLCRQRCGTIQYEIMSGLTGLDEFME